jgi:hypothetical protein
MTLENITLFRTASVWMAKTDSAEVLSIFGTDTIPTAYMANADAAFVMAEIRRLNPSANVSLS